MFGSGQAPDSQSSQVLDVLTQRGGTLGYFIGGRFVPRMAGGADGDGAGAAGGDGGTGGDGAGSGAGAGAGGAGGTGETGSDGQPFDAARAQRTIQNLRDQIKDAGTTKKERDDLAARLKAIEDKDKSDSEKLSGDLKATSDKLTAAEQRAAAAEAKFTAAQIRSAIDRESHKAGAVDADDVYALLSGQVGTAIKLEEDGTVSGADKAVAALLKAKPYLAGSANGTGTGFKSTPGTPSGAGNQSDQELVKARAEEQRKGGGFLGF